MTMKHVRFTKQDGKQISVNTSHVFRLEETTRPDETLIVASDGCILVKGTMDDVEAKLHSETAESGKRILNEVTTKKPEYPESGAREYKKPQDPASMFSDDNYDRPVDK
jgi:uncharacterized protein YlzI (FlbEa/FlbD family)